MSNRTACPDPLLLSRLLDHELDTMEKDQVTVHLQSCPFCQGEFARLQHLDVHACTLMLSQRQQSSPFPVRSSSCPALEEVVAYMQGTATGHDLQLVEQHVQT